MANETTLSGLIPDLYSSLDVVSREAVGFLPSVTIDPSSARAALNETVRSFATPAITGVNIAPSMTVPEAAAVAIGNKSLAITKSRAFPFSWDGENVREANNGPGHASIRTDQMQQAMRACVNEIESDLGALYVAASRAYGTAGATPFASDLSDPAQVRKILTDNGAPLSDLQLVINTTAGAKLRTLAQLSKANEAGTTSLREQGILLDIHNFKIRESAQVKSVTKGTGASYTTNTAGYAVGATSITLITGTGTVLAGDVVTFGSDTNKYVVATGVAAPGTIVLAAPGLLVAIPASATAMTIGANYAANMAFSRSAIVLVTRAPALPDGGDMATDSTIIQDSRSGMSFEVRMYKGYRRVRYELCSAWGVAAIKPEHIATLLG